MEMKISFPGGERVNAEINGWNVLTDQPSESGERGTAPTPFEHFLSSLGTCAGIYVLKFCHLRQIETEGLALTQRMEFVIEGDKKKLKKVFLEIDLPPGFPEKYRNAIIKTAELCTVKKVIMDPPEFEITARIPEH